MGGGDAEAVGAGGLLLLTGGSGVSATGGDVGAGRVAQAQVGLAASVLGGWLGAARRPGVGEVWPGGATTVRLGAGVTPGAVGAGEVGSTAGGWSGGAASSLARALRPPTTTK